MLPIRRQFPVPAWLPAILLAVGAFPARAVLFYDTGDASHNISAPTGAYADSGWQYEGFFGSYLGTMISPVHFITAAHIGVNDDQFVYDTLFSGAPTVTYDVDTTANGGLGYWDIGGTDLRVYRITGGTFPVYAPLYEGTADATAPFVVMGRGGPRGSEVWLSGTLKGWESTGSDGVARWGRNTFVGVVGSGAGPLLSAHFDPVVGADEVSLSVGDSGGGGFINDAGTWKLAGLNYAVETGPYDADADHNNGNEFNAVLFDRGGYTEFNGSSWEPVSGPSSLYLSRISDSTAAINGITGVPEPGGVVLVLGAGLAALASFRRFG